MAPVATSTQTATQTNDVTQKIETLKLNAKSANGDVSIHSWTRIYQATWLDIKERTFVSSIPSSLRCIREIPSYTYSRYLTLTNYRFFFYRTKTCSTEFTDPGLRADPKKPNLLKDGVEIKNISPFLGAIVSGVQISQLTSEGLDELALLAAEKKVVAFRDQDFKDLSPERQIEIARCVPCINSEWNMKLTLDFGRFG